MVARHDVTEARGGLHFHLVSLLYRFFLLGVHARACLLSTFGQFLQFAAALLDHPQLSQPARAEPPANWRGSGPALLGSNYAELLLMIVLSHTIAVPVPPKYPNPPYKPNRNSSSPLHVPTDGWTEFRDLRPMPSEGLNFIR